MSGNTTVPIASMNFSQLEENINKWTLDLDEQVKIFMNQATQVNAWDQLLIENGEKVKLTFFKLKVICKVIDIIYFHFVLDCYVE